MIVRIVISLLVILAFHSARLAPRIHVVRTRNREADVQTRRTLSNFYEVALRLAKRLESEDRVAGARMLRRLKGMLLTELDFRTSKRAGETVDKSVIEMCVRSRDGTRMLDSMALAHVFLHELAHVACESVGHSEEFRTMEQTLRRLAAEDGFIDGESTASPIRVCDQNVSWF